MSSSRSEPRWRRVLEALAKRRYATQAQLAVFCGVQQSNLSKTLDALKGEDLIDSNAPPPAAPAGQGRAKQPYFYFLRPRAAEALGASLPSGGRVSSWSVVSQACHRNAFEIAMRTKYPKIRFLSRKQLLKQRINLAHGDHAALIDDNATSWYVILDDYLMPPQTLAHRWTREHAPSLKRYKDIKPGPRRRWCDVANRFVVACTDPVQAERHREQIARDKLPAEVVVIDPLWP